MVKNHNKEIYEYHHFDMYDYRPLSKNAGYENPPDPEAQKFIHAY